MDSKQLQKIIDEELKKAVLEEGFLDSLKFAVSKLPNLERRKGPKVDAAIKQVGKIIDKESNQRFKEMMKALEARLPGFPNVKTHEDFLQGMEEFAMLYDGIVEEFNDGKLEAPIANALIGDLRVVVRKYLDYDLKDVYKHFKENQEKIDEALPFTNQAKVDKAAEKMRQDDQGGPIGSKYGDESETIKGLESNILPKVLGMGGLGTLLGGAAWFRELLNAPGASPDTIIDGTKRVFATVKDGDGFSQTLGRFLHNNPGTYGENFGARNFFENVKSLGITPDDPGPLQQMADDPTAFKQEWATISDQIQNNPDASMSDVFPASNKAFWIQKGAQVALGKLPKVIGGAVASTSGAAAGAATAGVFGAGLLASAAAVKLLRMKGLKSSRAQVFKDMLAVFKDVEPKTPQEQELQSGLEDIGVIPQDTMGEPEAQPEAQPEEKPEAAGPVTSTGAPLVMGGNYYYLTKSGREKKKFAGRSSAGVTDEPAQAPVDMERERKTAAQNLKRKNQRAYEDLEDDQGTLEEAAVSAGNFQPGKMAIVQVTDTSRLDEPKPQLRVVWLDDKGKPTKQFAWINDFSKLGAPSTEFPSPASRFAQQTGATTGGGTMSSEDQDTLRDLLQKISVQATSVAQREKYLLDITNLLVKNDVIGALSKGAAKGAEEEDKIPTNENIIKGLRKLKKSKVFVLSEKQINKIELHLKKHDKKLIEGQKIHNHWKKYAGLLKG